MSTPLSTPVRRRLKGPVPASAQILDVAERLVQTRGFNAFSYADVAAELGITKASLHYHYSSKADLGRALIDRYTLAFSAALSRIAEGDVPAPAQLERYIAIYGDVLKAGRICLCGMLAAEYTTLPVGMQDAIRAFFDLNERWLSSLLDAGRKAHTLAFEGTPRDAARALTAALEGALLLARPFGEQARFVSATDNLLRELTRGASPPAVATGSARRPRSKPRGGSTR
jgi:TetR/AcrR family transcriptional regulator, transcriptional repressor for nem operon